MVLLALWPDDFDVFSEVIAWKNFLTYRKSSIRGGLFNFRPSRRRLIREGVNRAFTVYDDVRCFHNVHMWIPIGPDSFSLFSTAFSDILESFVFTIFLQSYPHTQRIFCYSSYDVTTSWSWPSHKGPIHMKFLRAASDSVTLLLTA